jgi:hypothetical protein
MVPIIRLGVGSIHLGRRTYHGHNILVQLHVSACSKPRPCRSSIFSGTVLLLVSFLSWSDICITCTVLLPSHAKFYPCLKCFVQTRRQNKISTWGQWKQDRWCTYQIRLKKTQENKDSFIKDWGRENVASSANTWSYTCARHVRTASNDPHSQKRNCGKFHGIMRRCQWAEIRLS